MRAAIMIFLYGLALYVGIGVVTAIAFVTFGVTAVAHASMTLGARILLLPGATALWPYVASRWLKARHSP
jgi:hypothetical protein